MANRSSIGWTRYTINPGVYGCEADGKECRVCYAEVMAARQERMVLARGRSTASQEGYVGVTRRTKLGPKFNGVVRVDRARVAPTFAALPKKGGAVFVTSMGDLFHDDVPYDYIDMVFGEMEARPQHWFQVLTKRPKNARRFAWATGRAAGRWPKHIWLGCTWGDPARFERMHDLLEVPAEHLFVSMEPLLGSISPSPWLRGRGEVGGRIGWVIAGGESGRNPTPAHPDWFRAVRDHCGGADVPFFFKQWGAWMPDVDLPEDSPIRARLQPHHFTLVEHGDGGKPARMVGLGAKRTGAVLDGREHFTFPPGWTP